MRRAHRIGRLSRASVTRPVVCEAAHQPGSWPVDAPTRPRVLDARALGWIRADRRAGVERRSRRAFLGAPASPAVRPTEVGTCP
jgi:hypothetical protein